MFEARNKTQAEPPCAVFPQAVETRPRHPHMTLLRTEHTTLLYSLEGSTPASLQKRFFGGCTKFPASIDVTFLPLTSPSYRSQTFRPAATEGTNRVAGLTVASCKVR